MSAIRAGITGGQHISVLRKAHRPDQGAVLFRRRICADIQAAEQWSVSMAADSGGTAAVGRTELSVADGRAENRTAESNSEAESEGFILRKAGLFVDFMI